jgi:hypothetical protein
VAVEIPDVTAREYPNEDSLQEQLRRQMRQKAVEISGKLLKRKVLSIYLEFTFCLPRVHCPTCAQSLKCARTRR